MPDTEGFASDPTLLAQLQLKRAMLYTLTLAESANQQRAREMLQLARDLGRRLEATGVPNPMRPYRILQGCRLSRSQTMRAGGWECEHYPALDGFLVNCPLSTLAFRQGLVFRDPSSPPPRVKPVATAKSDHVRHFPPEPPF